MPIHGGAELLRTARHRPKDIRVAAARRRRRAAFVPWACRVHVRGPPGGLPVGHAEPFEEHAAAAFEPSSPGSIRFRLKMRSGLLIFTASSKTPARSTPRGAARDRLGERASHRPGRTGTPHGASDRWAPSRVLVMKHPTRLRWS